MLKLQPIKAISTIFKLRIKISLITKILVKDIKRIATMNGGYIVNNLIVFEDSTIYWQNKYVDKSNLTLNELLDFHLEIKESLKIVKFRSNEFNTFLVQRKYINYAA